MTSCVQSVALDKLKYMLYHDVIMRCNVCSDPICRESSVFCSEHNEAFKEWYQLGLPTSWVSERARRGLPVGTAAVDQWIREQSVGVTVKAETLYEQLRLVNP
jgi:hypothetical protein